MQGEGLILRHAILSRVLLLSLIIIWRLLFPPYDSSAQLNPSCLSFTSTSDELSQLPPADRVLWPHVGEAIGGSIVWDSVYFVRISECGYEYEQSYAFFPLLPISISLLSRFVFAPLIPVIGYRAVLALSGYVLNNIAFVLAAIYFYKLSVFILKDLSASLQASILFCFNPASIFYSSIYSESLYALFKLSGIFYLFSGSNTMAVLLLGLSGAARSNGAINSGYFFFMALLQAYYAITKRKSFKAIFIGAGCSICLFVPFAAFQAYGFYNFCLNGASDRLRPWCNSVIPNLYGYLQSYYWGVGFLRYFEVKQLPNFILASPILTIVVASITHYANLLHQKLFKDPLGKDHSPEAIASNKNHIFTELQGNGASQSRSANRASSSPRFSCVKLSKMDSFIECKQGYCSFLVLPFILHLAFMAFTSLFVMHVQVATRFLSASPPIYWFAAYAMLRGRRRRMMGYLIWAYFIAYILLGSLLFSNFYPFT